MAEIIDTLVTKFTADTGDFGRKVEQMRELFRRLEYSVEDYEQKAKKSFQNTGSSLQDFAQKAISFAAIWGTVTNSMDTALSLERMSKVVRMNAEDIQAWGQLVRREGGSAEDFNNSIKNLAKNLNDLYSNKTGTTWNVLVGKLGVQLRDGDKIKSAQNVLLELSDKLKELNNPELSLSIGRQLGLDDSTIRLLQKGRQEVEQLVKSNKELGVYDNRTIERLTKLNRRWQDIKQQYSVITTDILSAFLPALQLLADGISKVSKYFHENQKASKLLSLGFSLLIGSKVIGFVSGLARWLLPLRGITSGVTGAFSGLTRVMKIMRRLKLPMWQRGLVGLKFAFIGLGKIIKSVFSPITLLISAFVLLIGLWDDIQTWLEGGDSQFGDFYQKVADGWNNTVDAMKKAWEGFKNYFKPILDTIIGWINGLTDKVKNLLQQIGLLNDDKKLKENKQAQQKEYAEFVSKNNGNKWKAFGDAALTLFTGKDYQTLTAPVLGSSKTSSITNSKTTTNIHVDSINVDGTGNQDAGQQVINSMTTMQANFGGSNG